jgi:formate dehydrogenase subunit delta
MNSTDRLVYMANQIAENLMHEPDPATATANHIELFWDPRMKHLIKAHDGIGLSPTAAAAIATLQK